MNDASNSKLVLEVADLSAAYDGRRVLNNVSVKISEGESMALIGPNGCGKSTFLRTVAGLLAAQSGNVRLNGVLIGQQSVSQRINHGLGYLKQSRNVFEGLTVVDNLVLAARATDKKPAAEKRRQEILEIFPMLSHKLNTRAGLLSGGQKQSLAVAMVLMRPARVLLLDEPVAGLSSAVGNELLLALRRIQEAMGFAVIIVEHRLALIQPHISRVLVMREGNFVDDTRETHRMLDAAWVSAHYEAHMK